MIFINIGVILRPNNEINNGIQFINDNIYKYFKNVNCYGIINDLNSLKLLKNMDGIVLQGGEEATKFDYEVVKYCYENNKPLLGICLGMQTIGEVFGGYLVKQENHYLSNHDIIIYNNSLLYKIIGDYNINVNSRHKYSIKNVKIFVSARSTDGVIEAIEIPTLRFFLGVEWHPEDINDNNSKKIFDYFINRCDKD